MFRDSSGIGAAAGRIEVICGCMFSGKTQELIRRARQSQTAGKSVALFKPLTDDRYSSEYVVSHTSERMSCRLIGQSEELLTLAETAEVIAIDEAQFLDGTLPEVCARLAGNGRTVIAAGLDMDFRGLPFGPMPGLMAQAEHVSKLLAVCVHCGDPASFSFRTDSHTETILTGALDRYEARCRRCFIRKV